jgi:predicted RNase H-like HicB family nuclease
MVNYVGILDGGGSVWGVRIPDLRGCYGGGATPEAAIADAISAAREWSEHKSGRGAAIPAARSVSEIVETEKPDPNAGETVVFIPVLLDAGRTVRANLTLDAGLLADIDYAAELRGITRSAFVASAAREKIAASR